MIVRFFLALLAASTLLAGAADANPLKLKSRGGGNPAAPVEDMVLLPGANPAGSGWTAWNSTNSPTFYANQGSPADYCYSCNTIAHWNNVPYIDWTGDMYLEVMAYHQPTDAEAALGVTNNVAYVDFYADGGTPVRISTQTASATTTAQVFKVKIRAQDYADGGHSFRAVAYPTTGIPIVLQGSLLQSTTVKPGMFLNSNFGGTLQYVSRYVALTGGSNVTTCGTSSANPCASMSYARDRIKAANGGSCGGGIIKLLAGNGYRVGPSSGSESGFSDCGVRWLYVQPAEGVAASDVVLTSVAPGGTATPDGLRASKVYFRNLYVTASGTGTSQNHIMANCNPCGSFTDIKGAAENITYTGPGVTTSNTGAFAGWGGLWVVGGSYTQARNGVTSAMLARDVALSYIGSESIGLNRFTLNVSGHHIGDRSTGNHPDVYQWLGAGHRNVLIYGLNFTTNNDTAGLFADGGGSPNYDFAMINSTLDIRTDAPANTGRVIQFSSPQPSGGEWSNFAYVNSTINGSQLYRTSIAITTPGDEGTWTGSNFLYADTTCINGNPNKDTFTNAAIKYRNSASCGP